MKPTVPVRFWSHIKVRISAGHWLWQGAHTSQGYGQIRFDNRRVMAHRVAWLLSRGPIPPGLCVLHRCDTPACVKPDHLFLGTRKDNMTDMVAKGRAGRQYGNPSKRATLLEDTVNEIRHLVFDEKYSQAAVARKFGLHQTTVNQLCTGRRHA